MGHVSNRDVWESAPEKPVSDWFAPEDTGAPPTLPGDTLEGDIAPQGDASSGLGAVPSGPSPAPLLIVAVDT